MKTKINAILLSFFVLGIWSIPAPVTGAGFSVSIDPVSNNYYYQQSITVTVRSTTTINELHIYYKSADGSQVRHPNICYGVSSCTATFVLDIYDANPYIYALGYKHTFAYIGGRMRRVTESASSVDYFNVDITTWWHTVNGKVFDMTAIQDASSIVRNPITPTLIKVYDVSHSQSTYLSTFYPVSNEFSYSYWKPLTDGVDLKFEVYYDDPYNFLDFPLASDPFNYDMIDIQVFETNLLNPVAATFRLSQRIWEWDLSSSPSFDSSTIGDTKLFPEITAATYYDDFNEVYYLDSDLLLGIAAQIESVFIPYSGKFGVGIRISTFYSAQDDINFAPLQLSVSAKVLSYDGNNPHAYSFEFENDRLHYGSSDPGLKAGSGPTQEELDVYNFWDGTLDGVAGAAEAVGTLAFLAPQIEKPLMVFGGIVKFIQHEKPFYNYDETSFQDSTLNNGMARVTRDRDWSKASPYINQNGESGFGLHTTGQTYNKGLYLGNEGTTQIIEISARINSFVGTTIPARDFPTLYLIINP